MSKTKSKEKKKSQPKVIEIDQKPTLVLGKDLMNLSNYFHNQIGKKEWSGILFYTVEGTIKDIANMEFKAEHMMLKDVGTSASTGYEFDETVFDYFDSVPRAEDMKMGMIHTHHDMSNYFSSTDMGELKDNARNHNYYLSLIMSFDCDYSAKLAIHAKTKDSTVVIKGDEGEEIEQVITGEDLLYVADCQIVFELDQYNIDAVDELKKRAKKIANKKTRTGYQYGYGHGYQGSLYPVKSDHNKKKKKNPLADKNEVANGITGVLYCDPHGADIDIKPELAFKKMNEVLKTHEISEYIDKVEEYMELVVGYRFGGSELDMEEFVDAAIAYIEDLDIKDNDLLEQFTEMLKFHSSEYDDIFEEEEVIAI